MANCKQQTAILLRPFVRSLKFDRFQTLRNNMRQDVQTENVGNNNVGSCWPTMSHLFARSLRM